HLLKKSGAFCIVEVKKDEHVRNFLVELIPNKTKDTLIGITSERVVNSSTIITDEHPSYKQLQSFGFNHVSVC
ncbi:hypothetical protein H311_01885, partial [Anncaliia algerae PRA109]